MRTLNAKKVLEHIGTLSKPAPAAPAPTAPKRDTKTHKGGWSEEVKADGCSHFFTVGEKLEGHEDLYHITSLCNQYEGDALLLEISDCDPLAPENCVECRVALLKERRLIP